MPIYEFSCHDCGFEFERIQSFSDESVPSCTSCQSVNVVRKVGRPAIHFKGAGWYITDSKSKSKESSSGARNGESSESASSDGESSTASETKTESSEKSEKSEKPAKAGATTSADKPKAAEKSDA
ncbi:MAG: zinc ribbon domain-containing protein [Caldilineaceae bacterium]|nr:zinc ribbon domain-containing protein [Caldilineaceae bacterium]